MKKLYITSAILTILFLNQSYGQGCVAIRGNSSCNALSGNGFELQSKEFTVSLNGRYFQSFRHFRGSEEEHERIEKGTQVINDSYFVDLSVGMGITDRLYANITLPYVHNLRSSMYEHGGNPPNGLGERHETSSKGLGDVRLGVGYWLLPQGKRNFNYALGLGLKLPTGKYDYTDIFYNQGADRSQDIEGVVDQSIQLGDGGLGINLDFQGYHSFTSRFGLLTSAFYMSNPKATNGVLTRNKRSEFSCPDQFGVRLAAYANMGAISTFVGGRAEGVPASDLIGSSEGYRRPGYAVSVEPGISYGKGPIAAFVSVPIAVYRNRIQSYEDKISTAESGKFTQGDAAFADYLVNVGVSYRFGGHKMNSDEKGSLKIQMGE
ncbi:MAG TPA: transporter [Saprospiraceae bacterium]|nr:transporter [Saprospiraceae bacterium]